MAKRCFTIMVILCFLIVTSYPAGAHGGGLNRDGCHRETATGGYHCHQGGDDNNEDVLVALGVAAVVLLLLWVLKPNLPPHMTKIDAEKEDIGALLEFRF